jgi:hypothetical protein
MTDAHSSFGPRPVRIAAWLVAAALAGCTPAASEQPASASPTAAPTSVAPTDVAPTAAATLEPITPTPEPVSFLQRRDTPPGGVAAQFEYFPVGNGPCNGLDETVPAVLVDGAPPEVATSYYLCVMGFAADVTIDVTLTLPDGTVRAFAIPEPSRGSAVLVLELLPGEPIGIYTATATQGDLQATGSYEVFRAAFPRVHAAQPVSGPAGSLFSFALAGFTPGSQVGFDLYQNVDGGNYVYLTTLPPAITDAVGEAIYTLPTTPGDPQGLYCVVYRRASPPPTPQCDASFTLTP